MKKTILINISFLCFAAIIIYALVSASGQYLFVPATTTTTTTPVVNITVSTPVSTPVKTIPTTTTKPITTPTPTPTPIPDPSPTSFTSAQVAQHKNRSDCWTIVRGTVYDVTSWISQHPGGASAIAGMCGIDATSSFVDQHGGKSRPESELASFKIGTLK